MFSKELANKIDMVAREEISSCGLPTIQHYELSMENGLKLAKRLNANENLVKTGIALMEIKLGQVAKEGHQAQHVKYCVELRKVAEGFRGGRSAK